MLELQKFAKTLGRTKLRVFSQGDILTLRIVKDNPGVNASSLLLMITMAYGKVFSLSQLSPILKLLVTNGLLTSKTTNSDTTGRPMAIYTITRKGLSVLEGGETIVEALTKKA